VSSVIGDSQSSLKLCWMHLLAAIQLAVSCSELHFARCCALKWTGIFALESKVNVFILFDFKKCFNVPHSREKVEFIKESISKTFCLLDLLNSR